MIYKGYQVTFHNKKEDVQSWTNYDGDQRSIQRKYDIILHLPWGCAQIGEAVYFWASCWGMKSMPWRAENVEGRRNRWTKTVWEYETREGAVLALLDAAYPDLPEVNE